MIHGGLRYLEFYEFGLVRKSLAEREVMLRIAPQIVRPLRLCIPQNNATRPAWVVQAGLFIYDHLWPLQTLPKSGRVNLAAHPFGKSLKPGQKTGFVYSDCWVDDARLVVINALDARRLGADIRTRIPCTGLNVEGNIWHIKTPSEKFAARVVINATGPSARQFLDATGMVTPDMPQLRLVQGSHIVVPRLYDGDQAYMLQQPDGRIVFVFPYEGKYTLIGTTETDFYGDPSRAKLTDIERDYLISCVNTFFESQIEAKDIVWSYSGVRPLFDDHKTDARKVTRDYKFYRDESRGPTLLSIFGGKLTTYRPLAEEALGQLRPVLPQMGLPWTSTKPLPVTTVDINQIPTLLTDEIIHYFIEEEFVTTLDDILWRRTKWGLHLTPDAIGDARARFELIRKDALDA